MRSQASRGGYTVVEVLVASAVAVALLGLVGTIYVAASRMLRASYTSFLVSRDLSTGLDGLRKDLKETALGTLRVENGARPSVTFVTPYSPEGKIQIDSQGTPDWLGWGHYVLEPGESAVTGSLVRWVEYPPDAMPYPHLTGSRPAAPIPSGVTRKTVLRDVVFPGQTLTDGKGEPLKLSAEAGFSVRFLRLEEDGRYQPSDTNPHFTSTDPRQIRENTKLVEATCYTYTRTSGNKVDTIGIRFRVSPRY